MKSQGSDKRGDKSAETAGGAPAAVEEKIDFSNVQIEPLFEDCVDFETFSKSDFRAVKVLACEAVPKSKKLLKFTLDDVTGEKRYNQTASPAESPAGHCWNTVNYKPKFAESGNEGLNQGYSFEIPTKKPID